MRKSKKAFLFLIIIEIVVLLILGIRAKEDIGRIEAQVEKVREEIRQIQEENKRLKELEKKLSYPFFREKAAREKLGLAKKGEIIYWIVSRKSSP